MSDQRSTNFLVGIAGPSCSGKSTLQANLQSELGNEIAVFPFDDLFTGAESTNKDTAIDREGPDMYRWDDYFDHMSSLKHGLDVNMITNSKESVEAGIKSRVIVPRPVIVAAGFLALHNEEVNALFDSTIFIDLNDDEIVRRRLARATPGDSLDSIDYIKSAVLPGNQKYVLPQRTAAEHIVDGALDPMTMAADVIDIIRQAQSQRA